MSLLLAAIALAAPAPAAAAGQGPDRARSPSTTTPTAAATTDGYRARAPEDEIIYFVLPDRFDNADPANDRGGLGGGPLRTGFDPARKGFYHGGDLKGLIRRLDYI